MGFFRSVPVFRKNVPGGVRWFVRTALLLAAFYDFGWIGVWAADVRFYCPFDGAVDAAYSAGPAFAAYKQCRFVPGRKKEALFLAPEHAPVAFVQAGNLDKRRGSIEFWLRPDWDGVDGKDRALVWEPGPEKPGGQVIWLWKYGRTIRFDMRDPGDHYLTASIAAWKRGQWHHVLATWDCTVGTRLYLDGRKVAARDFMWTPRPHARFLLGCRDRGDRPAEAAIDEFRIYATALSEEEAAQAFAGTLPRRRAARVRTSQSVGTEPASPRLIFAVSFDSGSAAADTAGGQAAPLEVRGVDFSRGVRGKAAHFGPGSVLRYAEPGNLEKKRGTVMFWFRPDWPASKARRPGGGEIWRCLFREGPAPEQRHGSNELWIWCWGDCLRADVSDALDRYITAPITDWTAGNWHHIALTWDSGRFRRLYVDGEPVRGGRDSRKAFLPMQWDVHAFPWFAVGGNGTGNPAEGAIDELKIYDGPLASGAIRAEFARTFPVRIEMPHRFYRAGRSVDLPWTLVNLTGAGLRGRAVVSCIRPDGSTLFEMTVPELAMGPSARRTFSREVVMASPGRYEFRFSWSPEHGGPTSHRRIDIWGVQAEPPAPAGGPLRLEPVAEIDCTASLPPDRFVESAPTHVVETAAGRYREAGSRPNDRFAVRVRLPQADAAYFVDWEYPDDKPRTMEIVAQNTMNARHAYELGAGVFCGGEYPLSHKMRTSRFLYWAGSRDVSIIFMTCEKGRPAAVRRVCIRRILGRLPKLPVRTAAPVNGWTRMTGLYYEDPAMCYDFGGYTAMPEFGKTISRLMDYMDWFGQDLFMYPAVWYQGPLYPSPGQGAAMSRPHPTNFIEYLLLQFGDRGISFIPTWNLHNLPSVADFVWSDDMLMTGEGAASPLMIYWDGAPNLTGWHGTPPNYNPLHPAVRRGILDMVDEMLDLYADYPAFRGICFHLTKHVMLWFGDLDAGYNDYCIEAFEKATGIRAPAAADDPGRVNKRYRWIMQHARDAWIDWRCRAIHALYAEVARKLRDRRPDLRLVLNVYRPTKADIMGRDRTRYEEADYVSQVWREAGLDPRLYSGEPNIVIQRTIYPADYRWRRVHRRWTEDPRAVRDLNYAPRHYSALDGVMTAWINMHDRYWENAVGRVRRWKSFWGRELGWRVSTLNPIPPYCLESYLKPLGIRDFMTFTKGGFLVGTLGMEAPLGRFSQAFRALPARPFTEVPGVPGPAAVRILAGEDGVWFYLVNPTEKNVVVRLRFSGNFHGVRDLRTGAEHPIAPGVRTFSLSPMEFEAYFLSGRNIDISAPTR